MLVQSYAFICGSYNLATQGNSCSVQVNYPLRCLMNIDRLFVLRSLTSISRIALLSLK